MTEAGILLQPLRLSTQLHYPELDSTGVFYVKKISVSNIIKAFNK